MKTLKFNHEDAQAILARQKNTTWRLFDDKDLSVGDHINIIDKVQENDPKSWQVIGQGTVYEVLEKRLGTVNDEDMKGHHQFSSVDEVLEVYQGYYGARVTPDDIVKIVRFKFTPTNGEIPSGGMLLEKAKLYTDGGSRNNPGDSAAAFVISKPDGTVVEKSGQYIGIATNNQAEYYGFIRGMERARDLGIDKVHLMSDSQLVVNQMTGRYKVKNQELAPLHQQAKELADSFEEITFNYIPRELNKIADGEVNRILDEQERHKHR